MKSITCIVSLLFFTLFLRAQTNTLPNIELVPFASGFNSPVGIEHAGDSRLFIVEQTGKIKILNADGTHKSSPFLNLSDKISTAGFEQGLLGLAFDPDYATNGYFYVHYTDLNGDSRFSRFSVNPNNPNKALPSSEVIMLQGPDDPFRNHNGGQLAFGPDGYLYFTIGDGGSGGDPLNNAQDITTIFGKLSRIDPTADGSYDIPAGNPYAGVEGAAEEIWATGLRNPWRFSFDALTGDLWIPDVGQNVWEEVNTVSSSAAGVNYGWSCREGLHFFKADCDANETPFTDPIAEYAHEDEGFLCSGSVTGGFVYRGDEYPDMYGKYFYTDFCTGAIRTTYWDGASWVTANLGYFTPFAYSTFGQDINLELYLADKTAGKIYRFTDGGAGAIASVPETFVPDVSNIQYELRAADEIDTDKDELIREAVHQQTLFTSASATSTAYVMSPNPNEGQFTIQFNADNAEEYSATVRDVMGQPHLQATREMVKGINQWEFNSSSLAPGVYYLEIRNGQGLSTVKFVVE